jgi:hypothetical protein
MVIGEQGLAALAFGKFEDKYEIEEAHEIEGGLQWTPGWDFSPFFWAPFFSRFFPSFSLRDKLNRIRLLISVAHLGLRFGNFGKIPTRNAVCLKPALLKCDLGPFFLGALLTVHLPTMGFMCLAGMVGRGCMCLGCLFVWFGTAGATR